MTTYRVLSFDLDGTLVRTADEIAEAANRTLAEFGLPQQRPEQIARLIGAGARELMLRLLSEVPLQQRPRAGQSPVQQVLDCFDRHYAATAGTTAEPYPGCTEALRRLKRAGVRLACVTNKEQRHARRVLQATGLDELFDLLVAGDTLAYKKPHRSVLEHVLGVLDGQPAGTAHVGDSRIDVQAARNAGVAAWAVPYGYNAGEPIEAARPDRIFRDLHEVAEHVLAADAALLPPAALAGGVVASIDAAPLRASGLAG